MPVLLVTGGSRGIGAAIALRAATEGYDVAVTFASDEKSAAGVVGEIEARGCRGLAINADVAREHDVMRAFQAVDESLGVVDAVVINAGITGRFSRVDELDAKTLRDVMAVNVEGAFLTAREAVRRMSTVHGGRGGGIVAISSRAATLGSPGEYVHYAASKGAVETMVRGLAKEVAREGIRVNGVSPGLINTEIHARAGQPDRPGRIAPLIPMGRAGEPDEVATATMWLLSLGASYITGAILEVGGGR